MLVPARGTSVRRLAQNQLVLRPRLGRPGLVFPIPTHWRIVEVNP